MAFQRVAAICGFIFIALIIVATALIENGSVLVEDSAADIRAYVERDQGLHRWSIGVAALAIPFAALFFAAVVDSVRASDREHGEPWAIAALFGALALVAAAGVGDVLLSTLLFRGGEGLDDSTLRVLQDGQLIAYAAMGPGIATLTVAIAVPSLMHGVWPRWHAVVGLVVAAMSIVAPFGAVSVSDDAQVLTYFAFPGLLFWTLATSVVLFRAGAGGLAPTGSAAPARP